MNKQQKRLSVKKTTVGTIANLSGVPTKQMDLVVKGNTLTNVVVNGNFASSTGWTTTIGATTSINTTTQTLSITGNGASLSPTGGTVVNIVPVTGKRVYVRALVTVTNSVCQSIIVNFKKSDVLVDFGSATLKSSPAINTQYLCSGIVNIVNATGTDMTMLFGHNYVDTTTANSKVLQVQYAIVVDMGTDSSNPLYNKTQAEMDALTQQWFDGTKSTIVSGVKLLGKNLFDEQIEGGTYEPTTLNSVISKNANGVNVRNVNKIKLLPNTQYTIKGYGNATSDFRYWIIDDNNIILATVNMLSLTGTFTTPTSPSNQYLVFRSYTGNNVTTGTTFQLELGSSATTYEAYTEQTLNIPTTPLSLLTGEYINITRGISFKNGTYVTKITLSIGDYVQFGKYYGDPILWRVINQNTDGTFMIYSEKILCLKPFDAKGDTTDGRDENGWRVSYGSNNYEKSNLREWLNSAETTVTYSHQKPDAAHVSANPYDTEAGFLNNFTATERSAIANYTHKSILATVDSSIKTGGTQAHTYSSSIASVVQNYDSAYYKTVTDKVFLLDVKELNNYVYGRGYEIRRMPTAKAVTNSSYSNQSLTSASYWHNWISTPYDSSGNIVRIVYYNGIVYYDFAYGGYPGVVPALNLTSEIAKYGGTGSISDPYIIGIVSTPNPSLAITNGNIVADILMDGTSTTSTIEVATVDRKITI